MEEIIKSITEAEARAVEIKAQAAAQAAEIAQRAEMQAAEIGRKADEENKAFREDALRGAQIRAQEDYDAAIQKQRGEAKKYVAQHLQGCDAQVAEIVRRVCGGNR